MTLRGPVLAATDLTEGSDAAIRQGQQMAASLGAAFHVCHVLPEAYRVRVLFPQHAGIDEATQAALHEKARAALRQRIEAVTGGTAADIALELDSGSAHAGIAETASRLGAGVIVMGAGKTAARVARSMETPILVARPSSPGGAVLGATDFSDPSLPAIRAAADEARRRKVKLRLIHCLDIEPSAYVAAGAPGMMLTSPIPPGILDQLESDAHDQLDAALAATGAEGEPIVLREPPVSGILETAASTATALIVVGTRGRTGLARLALGSVAEDVMTHAPCSVLMVPLHPAE